MKNPEWTRDELILALDLYIKVNPSHISQNHPEIVKLSNLLKKMPIHSDYLRNDSFRNQNSVYMKLCNFLRLDPNYPGTGLQAGSKLDKEIWNEYSINKNILNKVADSIRKNTQFVMHQIDQKKTLKELNLYEEFPEGKILTQTHSLRERNQAATRKKKLLVLQNTGTLQCEVCAFDFAIFYGKIGSGFIECHHNIPVSILSEYNKTQLNDLSLICSNCHRIIHRTRPWLSVLELKKVLFSSSK